MDHCHHEYKSFREENLVIVLRKSGDRRRSEKIEAGQSKAYKTKKEGDEGKRGISSWGFVRLLSVEPLGFRPQIRCLWKGHVAMNLQQLTEFESELKSRGYARFFLDK